MSRAPRTSPGSWLAQRRRRRYLHRALRETGADRFGTLGEGSIVNPPAMILGHERIHVGEDVRILPRAFLSVGGEREGDCEDARLVIGDRVRIGFDMVIACCGSIAIGDDVLTADRVFIGDTYHEYRDVTRPIAHQGAHPPQPVSIGRGAFLGVGCTVLQGVEVGEGAFVGAGAVVTRDVPPFSVVVGNPARVIRHWNGRGWVDGPRDD